MTALRTSFLLAAALLAAPARADDSGVWPAFKGKIIVSDQELGAGYDSDRAMIAGLKKAHRSTIKGADGNWTLHMMAFLKKPAGAETVNIVYYDVTGKREQINFAEVSVQPTQKTVQINGNSISKELGFVAGHKYEILVTRLVGGKEDVYAKAVVTLK